MNTQSSHIDNRINHQGFILIEVLVSLLIVSIGFLGITKFQSTLIASSADSKARSTATNLAREKIEELRNSVLQNQIFSNISTCTAAGAFSGTSSQSLGNNIFAMTWSSTPNCTQLTTALNVQVSWTNSSGNNAINLQTTIGWSDPAAASVRPIATGNAGGINQPESNVTRGDMIDDYSISGNTLSSGRISLPDGATVSPKSDDNTWKITLLDGSVQLVIVDEDNPTKARIALTSSSGLSELTGTVQVHTESGSTLSLCNAILPLPSDVGYCSFPLNVTLSSGIYNPTTPINCATSPAPNIKAAGYRCYVGQGWYGNLSLYSSAFNGFFDASNAAGGNKACPEYNTEADKKDGWIPGSRSHAALIYNSNYAVIGQTGLLSSYSSALNNLDFLIYKNYKIGSGKSAVDINTCHSLFTNVSTIQEDAPNGFGGVTSVSFGSPYVFKPYFYTAAYVRVFGTEPTVDKTTFSGTISKSSSTDLTLIAANFTPDTGSSNNECITTYANLASTANYTCQITKSVPGIISFTTDGINSICSTVSVTGSESSAVIANVTCP